MIEAPRRKPSKPPIYARATELLREETGELLLALVPATRTDAEQPAWRKLHAGERVRVEITRPRNPGFHRLAHAIGKIAAENIDELSHLDPHAALKRLQAEAGLECDVVTIDASSAWQRITESVVSQVPETANVMPMIGELLLGKSIPVMWPRSIAFDSMDEDRFRELIAGICRWLSRRYWPTCTPEEIEAMAELHIEAS